MPSAAHVLESIPEMTDIGEKEKTAITSLLNEVLNHYNGEFPPQFLKYSTEEDRHILAYKYLKARGWNQNNALEMIKTTTEFRNEYNVDNMELFPSAFPLRGYNEKDICNVLNEPYITKLKGADLGYHAITPHYIASYHYWDKEGHPVLYDFSGSCKVKELIKSVCKITPVGKTPKDIIISYHLYMNLIQERLIRYADIKSVEKGGRRIIGTTVILNAEGLHLGMIGSEILDIVHSIFQMDQKYFPETLHRLFVINCSSIVSHIFSLISSSLDKNTQQKVVFCKKEHSLEVLKKVIDEDKIPKFLGGSCTCSCGCIPGIDYEVKDLLSLDNSLPLTEDISISAGKKHIMELELNPNEEIFWEFRCTKSRGGHTVDIRFHASFIPNMNTVNFEQTGYSIFSNGSNTHEATIKVIKSDKLVMDSEKFISNEGGILKLEWDNHSSWLHGKHIQLRIERKTSSKDISVTTG